MKSLTLPLTLTPKVQNPKTTPLRAGPDQGATATLWRADVTMARRLMVAAWLDFGFFVSAMFTTIIWLTAAERMVGLSACFVSFVAATLFLLRALRAPNVHDCLH